MVSLGVVFVAMIFTLLAILYTLRETGPKSITELQDTRKSDFVTTVTSLQKSEAMADGPSATDTVAPPQRDHVSQVARLYKLHELFYNGVPDTYDQKGGKVSGVKPDPKKAVAYLERACSYGNPRLWLRLASIYQNGMYNLEPDLDRAELYYLSIMERFPDPEVYNEAREQLEALRADRHNSVVNGWLNLPYTKKQNAHHSLIVNKFFKTMPVPAPAAWAPLLGATTTIRVADLFRAGDDPVRGDQIPVAFDADDKARNDMHNTHNSQVVATVAASLKQLKEDTPLQYSPRESLAQIRSLISSRPPSDKREDAIKSLDSIERNIIPLTSVGMTEVDALNVVWNRINSKGLDQSRADLVDILYDQLADMQEHGMPVCATGRVERIVDTLSTFDQAVAIKPTYIINEEMMNKASQLRTVVLEKYKEDPSHMKQLEMGTAPDQSLVDTEVKDTIRTVLHRDYVDSGIMTKEKFDTQVDKWINEI